MGADKLSEGGHGTNKVQTVEGPQPTMTPAHCRRVIRLKLWSNWNAEVFTSLPVIDTLNEHDYC